MKKYKVKYQLNVGKQEIELSTIVEYEHKLDTENDIGNVIMKANLFINKNMHIPFNVLDEADITVIPAP